MSDQLSITEHNIRVLRTLKPGDVVAFDRGIYDHCGIYKGEGKVVHKAGDDGASGWSHHNSTLSGCGVLSDKAEIKEDSFSKVADGCRARKNNTKDKKYLPRQPKDIVKAAVARIGEREGYNVCTNNCETFTTECRNGVSESDQGDLAAFALMAIGTVVVLGVGALIGYFVSNIRSEKKKTTQ